VVLPGQTSVSPISFVFSLYSGHLLSGAPYNITAPILISNAIVKTLPAQYVQNISLPTDQLPPLSAGTYYFTFWAAGGQVTWIACANQTSQLYAYCGLNQAVGGGSAGVCDSPYISPSATWVTLFQSSSNRTPFEAAYEYACFPCCSFSLLLFRLYANVETTGATTNPTTTSNTTPSPTTTSQTTSSQTSSNSSSSDASCVASFWLLWARLLGSF